MKRFNNAFTLTELLVALGVVAILCAILMPVIFNLIPNQNTIMAKRAYYTIQTIVSELINDEACYPDKTSSVTDRRIGFDDGAGTANCLEWTNTGSTDSAGKFKTLFRDKLGLDGSADDFDTADGIQWKFSNAAFNSGNTTGGSIKLSVDVNGEEDPNCSNTNNYNTELGSGGSNCSSRKSGFDRFQVTIYGNGKVEINSSDKWAIEAVKVSKSLTED